MKDLQRLTVEIPNQKKYDIVLGYNLIDQIESLIDKFVVSKVFVVSDQNVADIYLRDVLSKLPNGTQSFVFEPGEKSKTLETVLDMYRAFSDAKLDRKSLVVNLGGGITTDMGAFAASTYLRGLNFVNIATSLEAMVDASVGGKTGVNLDSKKNQVGVFAQPSLVVMDVDTLQTLEKRHMAAAMSEIIKHALVWDKKYLTNLENQMPMAQMIFRSVEVKAEVVVRDEKETGLRKLLNFGHTIGHALESWSFAFEDPLLHGEAVALGIVAEAHISMQQGLITQADLSRVERLLTKYSLLTKINISSDKQSIIEFLSKDKKLEGGQIKWTLIQALGSGVFDRSVLDLQIRKALDYIDA